MTTHTELHNLQSAFPLANGVRMPWLGLGVFKVPEGDEAANAVKEAVRLGYRSIDTAAIYDNEMSVGTGIREALAETGLARESLFVTSKVWNADLGYEETLAAYETSLRKLGLDYLDLYLIHWPVAGKYKAAWSALEKLYAEGRVKAIGVSNFHVHHLEDLLQAATVAPMVDQVELHPRLQQPELRAYAAKRGIRIEAWSPLMQGELLDDPTLTAIARRHGRSVAQVILRWDLELGVATIPKSTRTHRIAENADVFDFSLTEEDHRQIAAMDRGLRVGPDPDNFNF
ncbi:aldo/keto reductase [Cohnella hashimotonis]|uniref:Aldo/keto reductase n=1 Tax=Cohnella hashimotonis TaxID=2826895 RepID=A0ABT6TSW1_9BACL|nr:aldo/keto reductase [Cohnella hashimotonis]MDI4649923.1 aldo/keto reductase [Cohnella hashimotonis]